MDISSLLSEQQRRSSFVPPPAAPVRPAQVQASPQPSQPVQPVQRPPPPAPKPIKARKKDQPLLQRAVSSPRKHEHTFHNYTPNGQFVPAPKAHPPAPPPPPPPTSYPAPPPVPRRMSGTPQHIMTPTDYRHPNGPIAPAPAPPSRSPTATYVRRPSTDQLMYSAEVAARHLQQPPPNAVRIQQRGSISREPMRTSISGASRRDTPPVTALARNGSRNGSITAMNGTPAPVTTPPGIPASDPPTIEPRNFNAPSLSKEDLQTVTDLTQQLADNSYLYDAHIKLINLLHQGLISHIIPSESPSAFQEPHQYPLLAELRQARNAMDSRFPVGEELWKQWLEDECMLARTVEERVAVMELCQKAVQEEVGSAKLWRLYGDWMWLLYKLIHDIGSGGYQMNTLENNRVISKVMERRRLTEDEKVFAREIFAWNSMLDVWIQGMKAVEWHMNDSDIVWDPYVQVLNHDLARSPSPDKVKHVWTLFADRLQKPHASWQQTFQGFSQFVSQNYDESIYEDTMLAANKQSAKSKMDFEARQEYEEKLKTAAEHQDQIAEWTVLSEYLEWELAQFKRKGSSAYSFELYVALLERANLRFPTAPAWWEDHVDLIMDTPESSADLLALVHRASRHCPWSGNLWSKHLLAFEAADREFVELEDIKHRATSTGLLEELGGMDELITVYTAWCGFLRRRAFAPTSGEDERDVAEMGIRSVMENVKDIGVRKFGKDFKGDPHFRAERMYIKFLSQSGRDDEARDTWNKLIGSHGDLAEFWDKYYWWEMMSWARRVKDASQPPEHATNVLRQAARRPNLNEPEKIIDLYLHHCGQHESIDKLQQAQTEAGRATKLVQKRREEQAAKIAAEAPAQQPVMQQQYPSALATVPEDQSIKRKRDDQPNGEIPAKRQRSEAVEEPQPDYIDASSSETAQVKRDRENATAIVKHLPYDVTELSIRKFFRDCGDILNIQLVQDERAETTTATIEFRSQEDVLTAQTKRMKPFEGHEIEIQSGTATTLWVTNYPPEADEAYIRKLFEEHGEIVEVRFPSLKFNTHRRFCYVQFLTAEQANAASQLDGTASGDGLKLSAKISDPTVKQDRSGAMQEGREVFVGNLNFKVHEKDLRPRFEEYGDIENIRVPRKMDGKSRGIGFVVFATKEQAEAAVAQNGKSLLNRAMTVEISKPNAAGAKRVATTIIKSSASPEPTAATSTTESGASPTDGDTVMAESSAASPVGTVETEDTAQPQQRDHYARTLMIRNIPDTVNDAQIQALTKPYGALRKITLRLDKGEAMVEFEDVSAVGKAELGVQGHEIRPGVKLSASGRGEAASAAPSKAKFAGGFTAANVRRPGQGVPRRGGRGGLGFKRGGSVAGENGHANGVTDGIATAEGEHKEHEAKETNGESTEAKAGKSQDDFRAMLAKKE